MWSPYFRSFTVKRNNNRFSDNRCPFNHKITTFDGSALHCTTESLTSPHTVDEIEMLCSDIVKHVADVSGNSTRISQMSLYFEVDRDNKMWLCYCSRLKVRRKYSTTDHAGGRRLSAVLRYQPLIDTEQLNNREVQLSSPGKRRLLNKRCCVCNGMRA